MLSKDELQKIRDFIYNETGMLFEDRKNYYLQARVEARMNTLGIANFSSYYHELLFSKSTAERQIFIESITINETYFFRDFPQLQSFAESALPAYLEGKRKYFKKSLKVWSAACSTGEEAYTLSIILQEVIEDAKTWSLKIEASDIDRKVLTFAAKASYGERSMKDTPLVYRDKYFIQQDESWEVGPQAKSIVHFKQLNFMDQAAMGEMRGYDFIFCRNVLIYFDEASRKSVVKALYDALIPGGYLFLGHSESIGRITSAFELERLNGFIFHRKPLKTSA